MLTCDGCGKDDPGTTIETNIASVRIFTVRSSSREWHPGSSTEYGVKAEMTPKLDLCLACQKQFEDDLQRWLRGRREAAGWRSWAATNRT